MSVHTAVTIDNWGLPGNPLLVETHRPDNLVHLLLSGTPLFLVIPLFKGLPRLILVSQQGFSRSFPRISRKAGRLPRSCPRLSGAQVRNSSSRGGFPAFRFAVREFSGIFSAVLGISRRLAPEESISVELFSVSSPPFY